VTMTFEQIRRFAQAPEGLARHLSESAAVMVDSVLGSTGNEGLEVLRFLFLSEFFEVVLTGPRENFKWLARFPNGYGASVIRNTNSYGGDSGLFELAVMSPGLSPGSSEVDYTTPITSDVRGFLSPGEAAALVWLISKLPTHPNANR